MKLRFFIALTSSLFVSASVLGQANLLNATEPEDIGVKTEAQVLNDNDKPLEYGYVDDRDVLWAKTTWEIIDLDERVNFPLYYPIDTVNIGSDRRSLFQVLLSSIKSGKLEHVYSDSYFTEKRTLQDLSATIRKVDTTDFGIEQLNAGEAVSPEYIETRDLTAQDIAEYHIKGIWYFDKRQGELKYRLIGIAPVAPDVNFIDDEEPDLVALFWVFYPHVRDVLHKAKAFNRKNTYMPISFDHLLNSRRFSSVIYKEDNEQGDRKVEDYINDNALLQLLESQRIKESIRDFEQDMWNY